MHGHTYINDDIHRFNREYLFLESDLYVTARWLLAVSKIKPSSDVLLPLVC